MTARSRDRFSIEASIGYNRLTGDTLEGKCAMSISVARRTAIRSVFALACLLPVAPAVAVVVSPPAISKSFSADSMTVNSSVALTFTITNPNGATDLTGVSFNDNLPSGLIVANPDSLVGTCDPGVITLNVTSISLVGATILAGSSCVFSVDVFAIASGVQVNTTDPVTSNEGGAGNMATASVATDVVFRNGFDSP